MRPTIGITSAQRWPQDEERAGKEVLRHAALLESLGAEAIVLARGQATAHALEHEAFDGVLLSGGGDVAVEHYGGRADQCWESEDAERDEGELALIRTAFARRVPTLCVCRGLQVANVAFGGTLIEDIKSELGQRYRIRHHQTRESGKQHDERTHDVLIDGDSALARVIAVRRIATNSMHHQAIRIVAAPFRAVGHTDDGIIEAIELAVPEFFFYGVQWHPESLPDDAATNRLYAAFVKAAHRRGRLLLRKER